MPKYIIVLFIIFEDGKKSIFHVFQEGNIELAINMKEKMESITKEKNSKETFEIRFYEKICEIKE